MPSSWLSSVESWRHPTLWRRGRTHQLPGKDSVSHCQSRAASSKGVSRDFLVRARTRGKMPNRPARKGFAPAKDCHRGWRDKVGFTFRPGRAVFVIAAHDQWYDIPPGKIPARLFRAFHYTGDKLGKFRLDAEYTWCINYKMLDALGPDVMGMVHHDILAAMRRDPRIVIQTDWAVADEFETITGDCFIRRLTRTASPPPRCPRTTPTLPSSPARSSSRRRRAAHSSSTSGRTRRTLTRPLKPSPRT